MLDSTFLRVLSGPALALLVFVVGCNLGTSLGREDAGPEGPIVLTCVDPSECTADIPECSFGVCKRPCAANDGCNDPNTFCNPAVGYCEAGCRDSSTCSEGKVCSSGACIESQGCATKCDCDVGLVCVSGACQDPPAGCDGPEQCPKAPGAECEDFACNGFTHLCFDPDPESCTANADCIGRLGCTGGCTCTGNGTCVPEVACTAQNESTTCGVGNYCDGNGACQTLPACTADTQCTSLGLTCNIPAQQCQRPRACPNGQSDCTVAPATHCAATGFCAQPLCNNGGITCQTYQTCAADGRCVNQGPGGACTADAT